MPTGRRKLSFGEMVPGAFRLFWYHRKEWLRVAVVPVVASMVLSLIGLWVADENISVFSEIVLSLLSFVPTILFSVGWLRLVLLGSSSIAPGLLFHWTRRETRFFALYLTLAFGAMALVAPFILLGYFAGMEVSTPAPTGDPSQSIALAALIVPIGWGVVIGLAYVATRLSLAFPAVALDRTYGLARSWRDTKGNGMKFLAIVMATGFACALTLIPLLILTQAFDLMTNAPFALALVMTILSYVAFAVQMNALALAYRRLADDPQIAPPGFA